MVKVGMSHTLYATFADPADAERAAGELLNAGVRPDDLSVVRPPWAGESAETVTQSAATNVEPAGNDSPGSVYGVAPDPADLTERRVEAIEGDDGAEATTSITKAADAESGAIKGGIIGAGIGAVAAIVALIIPGGGFVIGAGALASALGGVVAGAGTGAAAGAIVSYLREMGMEERAANEYGSAVEEGGAIVSVTVPSNEIDEARITEILEENGASNLNRYAARSYVA